MKHLSLAVAFVLFVCVGSVAANNPFSEFLKRRCEQDPTKVWNPTTQTCDLKEGSPVEPSPSPGVPPPEKTIRFQATASSELSKPTIINDAFLDGRLKAIVPTLKFDPSLELISSLYAVVAVDDQWYVAQRTHIGDVAFIEYLPGRGPLPSYGVAITVKKKLREFTVFKTLTGWMLPKQGIGIAKNQPPDKILFYCGVAPGGPYADFGQFRGIVFEIKGY